MATKTPKSPGKSMNASGSSPNRSGLMTSSSRAGHDKRSSQLDKSSHFRGIDPNKLKQIRGKYRASIIDFNNIDNTASPSLTVDQIAELEAVELDDLPTKFATFFQILNWKEELYDYTILANHINIYLYGKECQFNSQQIATLSFINQHLVDRMREPKASLGRVITDLKKLVIQNSSMMGDSHDIFKTDEAKQHYRLYKLFYTLNLEEETLLETRTVETPFIPTPLVEAQTLEQYESEQGPIMEAHHDASQEPDLETVNDTQSEEVKQITSETIAAAFSSVQNEFDKLMEEQKAKFLSQISKLMAQ